MAGRSLAQALQNFVNPLQLALSCVATSVFIYDGWREGEIHYLRLSDNVSRLDVFPRLFLDATHRFDPSLPLARHSVFVAVKHRPATRRAHGGGPAAPGALRLALPPH